jgi:hypothetical protein
MKTIKNVSSMNGPILEYPLVALAAVILPACAGNAGDSAPSNEKVAKASEAVSWVEDVYWGQWGNSGPDFDMGPASDRTCFLTGVHGQLLGTTTNVVDYSTEATARVYIDWSTNHWFLQTHQGVGNGVNARAACVPYANNRQIFSSVYGQMIPNDTGEGVRSIVYIPASPNRQCFLSGLSAWNGFNQQGAQGDAYLWTPGPTSTGQDPNNWQFITDVEYAWQVPSYNQVPGGSAEAVCVDVGPVQGGVGPLSQDSVYWFSNEPNLACGLTFIGGTLSSDPLGGNDGVGLSYGGGGGWWGINATSGKSVATTCFL